MRLRWTTVLCNQWIQFITYLWVNWKFECQRGGDTQRTLTTIIRSAQLGDPVSKLPTHSVPTNQPTSSMVLAQKIPRGPLTNADRRKIRNISSWEISRCRAHKLTASESCQVTAASSRFKTLNKHFSFGMKFERFKKKTKLHSLVPTKIWRDLSNPYKSGEHFHLHRKPAVTLTR